ncbi:hypothetical protein T484DRAFT_1869415 [Baffinella frigidus]|nr:hypothetical protein T484DRAFT_1869415 [Cryptophyta sp. CCMP2293]
MADRILKQDTIDLVNPELGIRNVDPGIKLPLGRWDAGALGRWDVPFGTPEDPGGLALWNGPEMADRILKQVPLRRFREP